MPAVESLSECNQVVDRNLIVEVQCRETHRLKPLSNGISGVDASISQHLDLITAYLPKNETGDGTGSPDQDSDNGDSGFGMDFDEEEEDEEGKLEEEVVTTENAGTFLILFQAYPYMEEMMGKEKVEISRRESLFFQHEYHPGSTTHQYNEATTLLTKFCHAVKVKK